MLSQLKAQVKTNLVFFSYYYLLHLKTSLGRHLSTSSSSSSGNDTAPLLSTAGNWRLQSSCGQGHGSRGIGWAPQRLSCPRAPPLSSLHTPATQQQQHTITCMLQGFSVNRVELNREGFLNVNSFV